MSFREVIVLEEGNQWKWDVGQKEDSKGERDKVCYMKFCYENVMIKLIVLYN